MRSSDMFAVCYVLQHWKSRGSDPSGFSSSCKALNKICSRIVRDGSSPVMLKAKGSSERLLLEACVVRLRYIRVCARLVCQQSSTQCIYRVGNHQSKESGPTDPENHWYWWTAGTGHSLPETLSLAMAKSGKTLAHCAGVYAQSTSSSCTAMAQVAPPGAGNSETHGWLSVAKYVKQSYYPRFTCKYTRKQWKTTSLPATKF
jgi:hypothetical protein